MEVALCSGYGLTGACAEETNKVDALSCSAEETNKVGALSCKPYVNLSYEVRQGRLRVKREMSDTTEVYRQMKVYNKDKICGYINAGWNTNQSKQIG